MQKMQEAGRGAPAMALLALWLIRPWAAVIESSCNEGLDKCSGGIWSKRASKGSLNS